MALGLGSNCSLDGLGSDGLCLWDTTGGPESLDIEVDLSFLVNSSSQNSASQVVSGPDPAFARFRDDSRFWIQRVMVPLVVVVGVLGNAVTMVVLTRRRMRSSTNIYLTALAISDLLYLVFMFTLSFRHYPNIHDTKFFYYWKYWGFGVWLTDATTNTSVWLTVSFTVERYIAVCHPMRGKVLCTESRAKKVIIAVYLVCFMCTVTTPFEWQAVERYEGGADSNASGTCCIEASFSDFGQDLTYRTIYYWFTGVTFMFLPLLLLAVFNSFLIHAVRQSRKVRCKMTQGETKSEHAQSQENKITITLIAVVILFMLCQLPTAFTLIYTSFYEPPRDSNVGALLRGLGNIFNFLVAINASCNFLLYCAFSDKYRRTFLVTFLPWWYKQPSPLHSLSQYNTVCSSLEDTTQGSSPRLWGGSVRHLSRTSTCRGSSPRPSKYLAVPDRNGASSLSSLSRHWSSYGDRSRTRVASQLQHRPQQAGQSAGQSAGQLHRTRSLLATRMPGGPPETLTLLDLSRQQQQEGQEAVATEVSRKKNAAKGSSSLLCLRLPRFWKSSETPKHDHNTIQIKISEGENMLVSKVPGTTSGRESGLTTV